MAARNSNPRSFLAPREIAAVEAAIADAESVTSGQIKVIVARHCWFDLRRKARKLFGRFGLHNTARRNCVLILLITANRQFIIFGDRGIHARVGSGFWQAARDAMQSDFRAGRFAEGLCAAVREIGRQLSQFFPREEQGNELSDRLEFVA